MVEVRKITKDEVLPPDADRVLIETDGATFTASGTVHYGRNVTVFAPAPFKTVDAALAAATRWAKINKVPVVYVRRAKLPHARIGVH